MRWDGTGFSSWIDISSQSHPCKFLIVILSSNPIVGKDPIRKEIIGIIVGI